MLPCRVFRPLIGLLLAGAALSVAAAELPEDFVAALDAAGIPRARVAVVVQKVDAEQPRLSHNAEAALNPASVMKLVTSFAALDRLGPSYRWTTELWLDGPVAHGVLDGDLVVKGRGDPTLTLERMWLLQRALRVRGVSRVRGRLVLDAGYFVLPELDAGAFDGQPLAVYNALPGALVSNFNAVTLRLTPDGSAVRVVPDVALPGIGLSSELVLTDDAACENWSGGVVPRFADDGRQTLVLGGRYAAVCGERALPLNLFEPVTTFAFMFRGLWAESGGRIDGPTVLGEAPAAAPALRFASEPLPEALAGLNKYSNNLMARNLFLTLGAEAYGAPATPEKAARAVRESLMRRGVSTRKLVLENGAGLSRIERLSAAALTQLLRAAYRSPLFAEFESALPIVALDGTLKRRFNGSTIAGNAHLKTGTLRDVSALAGYVVDVRGERWSVVMLVNHVDARRSEGAQRALLEWVHSGKAAAAL